jgi:hypothetical protein
VFCKHISQEMQLGCCLWTTCVQKHDSGQEKGCSYFSKYSDFCPIGISQISYIYITRMREHTHTHTHAPQTLCNLSRLAALLIHFTLFLLSYEAWWLKSGKSCCLCLWQFSVLSIITRQKQALCRCCGDTYDLYCMVPDFVNIASVFYLFAEKGGHKIPIL